MCLDRGKGNTVEHTAAKAGGFAFGNIFFGSGTLEFILWLAEDFIPKIKAASPGVGNRGCKDHPQRFLEGTALSIDFLLFAAFPRARFHSASVSSVNEL
jgi:hypothetical protein